MGNDSAKSLNENPPNGKAGVQLYNKTGEDFSFSVTHQYGDEDQQACNWVEIKNGDNAKMMDVTFWFGSSSNSGRDGWIVHGKDKNGKNYRSGHGALRSQKLHTLTAEDNDHTVDITVTSDGVEIKSQSGTSTTSWDC